MNTRRFRLKASGTLLAMTVLLLAVTLLLGLPAVKAAATGDTTKATTTNAGANLPEGVAAEVNGTVISRSELEWAARAWLRERGMDLGGMRTPGTYKSLKRQVLQRLIQEELILQAADTQGVTVDEAQIDTRVREAKAGAGSDDEFANQLESLGLTMAEHREQIRRQLLLEEYVRVKIQPRVEVDQARVDGAYANYLEAQKDDARPEQEVRILIRDQLAQQVLAELISEHLETLMENSEIRIGLS